MERIWPLTRTIIIFVNMTVYLRDEHNKTVVDIEVWDKSSPEGNYVDVRSSVILNRYSHILLNSQDKEKTIDSFTALAELRGWFWEKYRATENYHPTVSETVKAIEEMLEPIAMEFKLHIVKD